MFRSPIRQCTINAYERAQFVSKIEIFASSFAGGMKTQPRFWPRDVTLGFWRACVRARPSYATRYARPSEIRPCSDPAP
jgi:hypothetical protein